jgi:hypothetical protein
MEGLEDDMNCQMNFVSKEEHVPKAERNNRVIKERTRAVYHHLPYKNIPKIMVQEGVADTVLRINWVPPKGGVLQRFSPYAIIHQKKVDYKKHCMYTFGDYVQTHEDGSNNLSELTLDVIYLRPEWNNDQAGHRFMNLSTGKIIQRQVGTKVNLTPAIIKRVEALAAKDGIRSYKFQSKYETQMGYLHPYPAEVDGDTAHRNETENDDDDDNEDIAIVSEGDSESDNDNSSMDSKSNDSSKSSDSDELNYPYTRSVKRTDTAHAKVSDAEVDDPFDQL